MLMVLFIALFIPALAIAINQLTRINQIAIKYGISLISNKEKIPKGQLRILIKSFLIMFGVFIGYFLIVLLIIYIVNWPNGFHVY